ncbi:hypothetical protein [Luteimonas sp. FCS-9]|uniref:hypothetical protein n=1 Tax=Luteimonas sp. FCS-9 TaxID=1547516 RepID=UPI000B119ED9|nr:hypothetical protein [Luteimonas sp. FCS-9]
MIKRISARHCAEDALLALEKATLPEISHCLSSISKVLLERYGQRTDDTESTLDESTDSLHDETVKGLANLIRLCSGVTQVLIDKESFSALIEGKGEEQGLMLKHLAICNDLNNILVAVVSLMQYDTKDKIVPNLDDGFLIQTGGASFGRFSFRAKN